MRKILILTMIVGVLGGLGAAGVYASQHFDGDAGQKLSFSFGEVKSPQEVRYDVDTSDKDRLFKKAPKTKSKSVWE